MEYIKVGQIISFFGIKGEVKLYPLTHDLDRFKRDHPYYIGNDHSMVHIKSFRDLKNVLVVKFEEFDNINEVLKFRDQYLYVSSEDLLNLEENEYYIHDLIGLDVVSHEDKHLGKLVDVIENSSNDIYVIETADGKIMIPAVREFILDVDLGKKTMKCKIIEGFDEV